MKTTTYRCGALALALASLLLASCREKHEPLKPTVTAPAPAATAQT